MLKLRQYQTKAVEDIRGAFRRGRRAPLFVLATGGGKTVLFSYMVYHAARKGGRVIIVVHRDHLLTQTSDTLTELGVPHGVIAPHYPHRPERSVQIASAFTLTRRLQHWADYNPTLIVEDEAHHSVARTWTRIMDAYPNARHLGVTATPERLDGKGLIAAYDELIIGPSMQELILNGYLAQFRIFAPTQRPDLAGLRNVGGDYNAGQLAERMDRAVITGNAVEHYQKHLGGKPAIAFCVTVNHAEHVRDQFRSAGLQVALIEASTHPDERKQMLADLAAGRVNVLTSCEVISEGVDVPVCQGAILLRPTQSVSMYLQQVGRCLRPKPDDSNAVVLDHAGNSLQHGLPDDDRVWTLQDGLVKEARDKPALRIRTCSACFEIFDVARDGSICPGCGHDNKVVKDLPHQRDGELSEQSPGFVAKMRELEQRARARGDLEKLERLRVMKGYARGWPEHVLRGRLRKKAMKELAR